MANSDLGISHLRFQNNKTASDRAYWTALLNLYRSLLHWNNYKEAACSRWCQRGCDSWIHQGRAVKKKKKKRLKNVFEEYIFTVSYFHVAFALPSWVEMGINFSVKGDQTDKNKTFKKKKKSRLKKPTLRVWFVSLSFPDNTGLSVNQ